MDIHHKHGPIRNWREFLKEYGIIVLGVLTALAGEQVVEAVHHHYEAQELREALDQELTWDFEREKDSTDLQPCVEQRLDEVVRWADALAAGHRPKLDGWFDGPSHLINRTSVWRSAAGGTLDQIELDKRVAYALFYDHVEVNDGYRQQADQLWSDLAEFEPARTLSPEQHLHVLHDAREIRSLYRKLALNYDIARTQFAPPLGITIEHTPNQVRLGKVMDKARERLCKPVLAE